VVQPDQQTLTVGVEVTGGAHVGGGGGGHEREGGRSARERERECVRERDGEGTIS
jgi:hypothetical protein